MTTTGRLTVGLVLALELFALAYVTAMAWLVSVWFLDDAEVVDMLPADWWSIAGQRLAVCAVVAASLAGAIYALNSWLLRKLHLQTSRLPRVVALLFFGFPLVASLAGAIQFGVTKPYM